jgi:DNA-binding LytR/AlgR family response regulator
MINCILIDDEPFALEILKEDLGNIPFINVVGVYTNPFESLELIDSGKLDLIFIDIQMPIILGSEFLKGIKNPPLVIFTTAHEKFALIGYELNIVDYLLKPISMERLFKASNKAFELINLKRGFQDLQLPNHFFIKSDYKDLKIDFDDILYIEGLKDYVKIFLESKPTKAVLARMNIKGIYGLLPKEYFIRVHQSYIIPFRRITSFNRKKVFLGEVILPIGPAFIEEFTEAYKNAR